MNEVTSTQSTVENVDMARAGSRRSTGRMAVVCSALGCLGWMGVVPLLDACDQGELLARFFAYLFNVIVIAAVGGTATVLLIGGWWLSRGAARQGDGRHARICLPLLLGGTVLGGLVILFYLIPALLQLR